MNKVCLINQPVGLGDILFCQQIGWYYNKLGYEIVWPIDSIYLKTVKEYINNPFYFIPKIPININQPVYSDEFVYLPLDGSSNIINDLVMLSKIKMARIIYNKDWTDYVNIKRNYEKENKLFNELGINIKDKYVLVNYNFASPPYTLRQSPEYSGNLKIVEMSFLKEYTLFDWFKVIKNATEIYMTDSCPTMLVEIIKSKRTKKYTAITRQSNFEELKCMYNLNWNFIRGVV